MLSGNNTGWGSSGQPISPEERFVHLDVIRGLALFGVLLVNLETVFRIPLLEHILGFEQGPKTAADQIVDFVVDRGMEFKALTVFSLLFGAGVAIQAERAAKGAVIFLLRRLGWLFLFGVFHLLLVWNGDILALYAVSALVLLPGIRMCWPALLVAGAMVMTIPEAFSLGLSLPQRTGASDLMEQARTVYANGGAFEILAFRWRETRLLMVPLLIGILPRTAGFMLWGMAAWRSGILRQPGRHRSRLVVALVLALALGLLNPSVRAFLAFAYLAALLLLLTPKRAASLPGLAAAGRMALSNYLTQSIVLGFLFYGYGLGLFGRIGSAASLCIAVALFAVQVRISRVWLSRFQFGPAEWLWRSLTYGVRQPLREPTRLVVPEDLRKECEL